MGVAPADEPEIVEWTRLPATITAATAITIVIALSMFILSPISRLQVLRLYHGRHKPRIVPMRTGRRARRTTVAAWNAAVDPGGCLSSIADAQSVAVPARTWEGKAGVHASMIGPSGAESDHGALSAESAKDWPHPSDCPIYQQSGRQCMRMGAVVVHAPSFSQKANWPVQPI